MSFVLEKWYLDLVTAEGVAVVGYRLALRWLTFELQAASRLRVVPGAAPDEHSTLGETAAPALADDRLRWAAPTLGLTADYLALDAPIQQTLLDTPTGRIDWACLVPRARARVVIDGTTYDGLGYAEHLRLTLPPWTFPFHTLRWGRHLSDSHALIWIEWDGDETRRLTWLDGVSQPEAHVVGAGLDGLTGGRALRWHQGHDLTRRGVGATLARVAPTLGTMLAGRLTSMQERKQCARSALVEADGVALDTGWAIHEEVTW